MTGYVADLSWKSGARAIEKLKSTKVDAGDFKHELLNRLRSTMAVNVLTANDGSYTNNCSINNLKESLIKLTEESGRNLPVK